ncbi:hypothetical protein GS481_02355 [Rhodococcus hoagii]|nr:hypothetical protein [Prescottella equi]NKR53013.1 hypothetical protein [Prescottella equi]
MSEITADEYRTAGKALRSLNCTWAALKCEQQAARLEAESARDEEAERLAQALFSGTAGHFVTASTWDAASDHSRNAFRAAARAALDFLAADGRLLPEGGTAGMSRMQAEFARASARMERLPDEYRPVITPPAVSVPDSGRCTGAGDCEASPHEHGCFADTGDCDDPGDHPDSGPDGTPEKPWERLGDIPDGVDEVVDCRSIRWRRIGSWWTFREDGKPSLFHGDDLAPFVRVDGDKA